MRKNARVAFSPDGEWLAISTNKACSLRRTGTWQVAWTVERDSLAELEDAVAFSPDGSQLAMPYNTRSVRIVSVADGSELVTLEAPDARSVGGLSFDRSGSRLAVFANGRAHVWDLFLVRRQLGSMGLDWPGQLPKRPPASDGRIVGVEIVE